MSTKHRGSALLGACVLLALAAGPVRSENAIELIATGKPAGGWAFGNGAEFPGATGSLALAPDAAPPVLVLHGDFTKGGNYVQASSALPRVAFDRLSFRMKAPSLSKATLRLIDSTNQCHQIDIKLTADDGWHVVDFPVLEFFRNMGTSASLPNIARYEHWGGAKDGKWHPPCKLLVFLVGRTNANPVVDLSLSEMRIYPSEGLIFHENFDAGSELPKGWESQGAVSVDTAGAFKGNGALKLARTQENLPQETAVTSPAFDAAPGPWKIGGATRSDLNSPDNSYNATVSIQALGPGGGVIETLPVAERFGKSEWQAFEQRVELPQGTARARLLIRLNKADGSFWIDELRATRLAENVEKRIARIEITTDRLGNLLLPDDKPLAHIKVAALRPLKDNELTLVWSVRDYWGAEQAEAGKVTLNDAGKNVYSAAIDLSAVNLELGRYYELHVELPRALEPEREFAGLARLPVAVTRQHSPDEIPFTIRNWDNRIKEYFFLADRLGLRSIGIWGGWDSKPPYMPHAPGLEWCKELGAKWVTTTPAASVEHDGFKEYNETALHEGMRNFLKEFAGPELAFIAQGNEPHGKIEKVKENVKAYRAIYEEVKKFNPAIFVIGTSVEPNDDYFSEGYYQWLDAYDFHVYGSYQEVRKTMHQYRELMDKYHAVKPIFSTELGLNSQGMPRHAVAVEMVKTFSSFFAEGGVNASWFTIQYPDPKGNARGTSGDAHCVFDCKYSHYNPRLDAVTYYTMVNGICVKKFAEEKAYPDGTQAYLFKDKEDNCMIALWNDNGPREVGLPIPGIVSADLVRIDGSRVTLVPDAASLTLGVSPEPILLFYTQKTAKLPDALATPAFSLTSEIKPAVKGRETILTLSGAELRVSAPPRWTVTSRISGPNTMECHLTPPDATAARNGRICVQRICGDKLCGDAMITLPVSGK